MSDVLQITREGAVVTLTLNRPDKLNALNAELVGALKEAFDRLAKDPSVGVAILTGAGEKAFAAGADIAAMAKMSDRERLAFSMFRFEGLAYKEIADALQASEAAVKSLIHRATLQVMKQVEALRAGLLATGSQL